MHQIEDYRDHLEKALAQNIEIKQPEGLYSPISYIISLGGKRIRPILTMMAAEIFGSDFRHATAAAMAVEVFHNFSLVHDDIMDQAPLRRGNVTVHEKWDLNTGILSGDAMLILAYRFFERYEPEVFRSLAKLFSKTALEVCEGQQLDVDFESRKDVTVAEYLKMIEYKTAVLLAAALQMGGIVAGTSEENCRGIYEFGRNLGIAFQIQDDYLDAFGDPETFGKQVGGDIIENKKTYLYLKALEFSGADDALLLQQMFSEKPSDPTEKIERVKSIFESTGAARAAMAEIRNYTFAAMEVLGKMQLPDDKKDALRTFALNLMERKV